jgi:hypothetical protein
VVRVGGDQTHTASKSAFANYMYDIADTVLSDIIIYYVSRKHI